MVHYAIGATAGALYAVLADELPRVTMFAGGLFGVGVWVVADRAYRVPGKKRSRGEQYANYKAISNNSSGTPEKIGSIS